MLVMFLPLLFLGSLCISSIGGTRGVVLFTREDPEVKMDATQLINSKGFPCENYYVTTEDGYILNLLRIPHGRRERYGKEPKPVVLLQHGLMASATNFLVNLVNESLAYILADSGADVWLGNSRGNIYSTNHTHLDPKKDEFWQFSWDEMAKYDLPAVVDFITSKTSRKQIYYVGHSQGTTIAFAGFGQNKKLASKIKHFIAMAPIARVGHIKGALKVAAPFANDIALFADIFGHGELKPKARILRWLSADLCRKWGAYLCEDLSFITCGFDFKSLNMSRVPVYVAHGSAGTSVQDLLHWGQQVNAKKFQMFDFGSADKNKEHYGQPTPPEYNPQNVSVPVAVLRGGNDWLADETDVSWLLPQLNITDDVFVKHYEHLDFTLAIDAPRLIYQTILDIIFSV